MAAAAEAMFGETGPLVLTAGRRAAFACVDTLFDPLLHAENKHNPSTMKLR